MHNTFMLRYTRLCMCALRFISRTYTAINRADVSLDPLGMYVCTKRYELEERRIFLVYILILLDSGECV